MNKDVKNEEIARLYLEEKLSPPEISKIYGMSESFAYHRLRKMGIFNPTSDKFPVGKVINNKKILEIIGKQKEKERRRYYKIICLKCNKIAIIRTDHFSKGRKTKCDCPPKNYKGFEDLSGVHFGSIKQSAKTRNIEFDITIEYIWDLYEKQNRRCAISNVEIILSFNKSIIDTASLDRIDSSKGYIEGNVQWVHKKINFMKLDMLEDEFIEWCKRVANNN